MKANFLIAAEVSDSTSTCSVELELTDVDPVEVAEFVAIFIETHARHGLTLGPVKTVAYEASARDCPECGIQGAVGCSGCEPVGTKGPAEPAVLFTNASYARWLREGKWPEPYIYHGPGPGAKPIPGAFPGWLEPKKPAPQQPPEPTARTRGCSCALCTRNRGWGLTD